MSEGEGPSRGPTVPLTAAASDEATALLREFSPSQIDRLATAVDLHDSQPTKIGPYNIVRVIGEGGMGVVYLAEQLEPIRRTVALKLIKLGMDTRQVIARFESERQALAVLNHPNVAKVLDAGTTETGRPYFVMEYVPGEPITGFCDHHNFTNKRRLELFVQACEAVQHAHQKAIIHRDLKPSNILVMLEDGKPLVKVIDFGVAKATAQKLTERTLFTEAGQLIGTPEYMSPEQAELTAIDVDTRSDIYSLGVVLYELLTGALPFDPATLRASSFDEIRRMIREVDPPRPSTRLSSLGEGANEIASRRQTQIQELTKQLRSELEWIPLKALRKDRAQRYASATELAQDISNYLENKPLRAGPESTVYRLRKFLRRNKVVFVTAAAFVAVLALATTVSTWQAIRATHAETRALQQEQQATEKAAIAEATNQFLSDMLSSADPNKLLGDKVTVYQAVKAALKELDAGKLKDRPLVEAAIRETIGTTLRALGRYDQAALSLYRALEVRLQALADDHPLIALSLINLAYAMQDQGKLAEAEPLLRQALAIYRNDLPPEHPDLILPIEMLAKGLRVQGKLDEAEPLFREGLAISRRTLPSEDPRVAAALHNLAQLLDAKGNLDQAETMYRESLALARRALPPEHPDIAITLVNIGTNLCQLGRLEEAEPLFREALQMQRKALPAPHKHVALSLVKLADLCRRQGKLSDAEPLYREALGILREVLPPGHPFTNDALGKLSALLVTQGKLDEAEPLLAELHRMSLTQQIDPKQAARFTSQYGPILAKLGRYEDAEQPLREALDRLRATGQENGGDIQSVLAALAEVCDHTNRRDEAAKWRAELAALEAATQPATQPATNPS